MAMTPRKDRTVRHPDCAQSLSCNSSARFGPSGKLLLALAAIALIVGAAFNWSWLVAAGIVPLLLGILPCAVMCGLGFCSMKMSRSGSKTIAQAQLPSGPEVGADRGLSWAAIFKKRRM